MSDENRRRFAVPARRAVTAAAVVGLAAGVAILAIRPGSSAPGPAASPPIAPASASAKAIRVDAPPPATLPPGAPGCGLASPAFCEDFEGARNTTGNRNGDISTTRFSLARWKSSIESEPNPVGRAQIPACRAGSTTNPLPPGDSLICDPTGSIASHYALVSTAEQNYGDNSYRLAQQFDITGRTGVIRFQTSLYVQGGLLGWPTLGFTADPYSAPSYLADNSAGPTPREGLQIHFNSVCPGPDGWTPFPNVRSYHRYTETEVHDENNFDSWCTSDIKTQPGLLNQVEIHLSPTHIEIWMSDASSNGVNYGALKKVYSAPINLTFTRGYVYFGVHNHATVKYASLPSWTVQWDNIGFDGPSLVPERVYQVANASVASGAALDLGYWLPNSATGGATPALALAGVSTTGATSGTLVFDIGADQITNNNWSSWRINYRFNGGAWHAVVLSADELALLPQRSGSFAFSVPINIAELASGNNTVQFSGTNFYGGYQPYVANIDLLVR